MMLSVIIVFLLILIDTHSTAVTGSQVDIYEGDNSPMSDPKPSLSIKSGKHIPPDLVLLNIKHQDDSIEDKRQRSGRGGRRKKGKSGGSTKILHKSNKTEVFDMKRLYRNSEKVILVRNRTIEILKNGVKILSGNVGVGGSQGVNKSTNHVVNETLLEKILSSSASKPDLLVSSSGLYKLPIGDGMYKGSNDRAIKEEKTSKLDRKNENQSYAEHILEYEYDYDGGGSDSKERNNVNKSFDGSFDNSFDKSTSQFVPDYDSMSIDNTVRTVLEEIIETLQNSTHFKENDDCVTEEEASSFGFHTKDPCAKWLQCKNHLEVAFLGRNVLPSCPCHYPSTIFYNDAIWDQNQKRFFRWRDASNEAERLDIYKPGAVYCIRSLLTQGSGSISSQQCCYDGKLRLITRGSGAGTINFVSPDVSKALHDTIDILPWRLCKGDFTRYNLARRPDNGNQCPVNPNEEVYDLQVRTSKFF